MDQYGNYGGSTSSGDNYSLHSGSGYSTDGSGLSILSTSTTYGTFGSWTGGDTHASGYEADVESNCSYK